MKACRSSNKRRLPHSWSTERLGRFEPDCGPRICKPSDLAIVVTAHKPKNIGTILRVLKKHHNQNALFDYTGAHIWMAEAPRPMVYDVGGKIVGMRKGAVPDAILRPIRGSPAKEEICSLNATEKNSTMLVDCAVLGI